LAQYKRSLEQRNALLRRAQEFPVSDAEFEPWEVGLAEHGAPIREARIRMVGELAPLAASLQAELGREESLELVYETKDEATSRDDFLKLFSTGRSREIARGSSNYGPHRDDLAIVVQGKDARYFGSQGQQRTAVLAVKLACHVRQTGIRGVAPLLLLDDILSDLDEGRRSRLVSWLLGHARQAVLTCTEPQAAGEALLSQAALFRVVGGTVTRT
jgi:DNA replication and repair protein RecF